uniref:Iron-regulated ABC transporter permease protein SufD n=1 Tax=Candidatus Kentrum eta TaxID=2126337 RepID=A0A450UAM7_9GAMM|nr:MAG: Iron-regulated ABC transporter permease protein SufD [Candidatus Kentron sp. H]VFJ91100.1 MAG: Iron-regulated ABC transporter permease protein SufD [Candidatus Kentron sp. H]VFJ97412.1 MAG: Iron-regulated ABC transporter permease protein SufD [Candidatus Kentron sp. H]
MSATPMNSLLGYATEHAMDHYGAAFSFWEPHLPGARIPWMRDRRRYAFDAFRLAGFPSPSKWEKWQHVPVDTLTEPLYRFPDREASRVEPAFPEPDRETLEALYLSEPDTHRLVFLNGYCVPQLSRLGKLPDGVIAGPLTEGLTIPAEAPAAKALKYHLDRYVRIPYSGFALLNTAFFADGAFIYLPPGKTVEAPVHLIFLSVFRNDAIMSLPRILVVAEENSAVDVVESFASIGETGDTPHFTNAVTEVALGPGARVNHCKLQTESARAALHVALLAAHQDRDSRFVSHSVSAGALIARNDVESTLDREGCECTLDGLYVADGRQHVDHYTFVDHIHPHGTSTQHYKGILAGRSHGVFNGKVYVYPDAQHTNAKQRNENLLLSRDARMDTKPQLDICADDVQCAHGATVGQIDENMVFYLRSRGIAAEEAENLLTYGFASEIVHRAPIAAVRTKLTDSVLAGALDHKFVGLKRTVDD